MTKVSGVEAMTMFLDAVKGRSTEDRLLALEKAVKYLLESIDTSHYSPLGQIEVDGEIRGYIRSLGFDERR